MINVADSSAIYYYHYDGQGSVVALSDSFGTSRQSYEYGAYGRVRAEYPEFTANPYMYTGRRFDFETRLYYYRARYYNPYIGRFLQTDPIGYDDGMNLYRYCMNNPLNMVDPSGHFGMGMDAIVYDPCDSSDPNNCYWGTKRSWIENIFVPDYVRKDIPNETGATDGYLKHCIASCRVMKLTRSAPITMCAALTMGNDWPGQGITESTLSDRKANVQGIINGLKFWKSCESSCRESSEEYHDKLKEEYEMYDSCEEWYAADSEWWKKVDHPMYAECK